MTEEQERRAEMNAQNLARADEFAKPGSLKHFMLRQGFMPDNEEVAEIMLINILKEWEELQHKLEISRFDTK
jgi:hypothetical protein